MASNHDEPESSCSHHEMELPGGKRRRFGKVPPKHDIFLSHSGQEKQFVEQLYHDLLRMNQRPFFDQDSDSLPKAQKFAPEILKAAEQCRVGVVVVSEGYLTSKWPMLELSKFVEHKRKLFPLFFKLSPSDLKENEVETRWKQGWRQLVEKGEIKEEVLELWSAAVKELRSSNGLEYGKFGNSEYKYRCAVVEEICKVVPPILEWSTDEIQGCERLCAMTSSMFETKVMGGDKNGYKCLGLHGMGGVGKTTLCMAMCSYSQGEFGGRVFYVELPSDQANERIGREGRLSRLKHVILQFGSFDKSISDSISTEEQGWQCLKAGLENQPAVFLAIDNVGDFESLREEARRYVNAGLPLGSKVLVTARSREILKSVLGQADCCKPIPRLEWVEAATLFLSKAAPNISSVSSLKPKEREIVDKCLSECQFKDGGYPSSQYHPLVLRALGTYFHDVDSDNVVRWEEALANKNKLQRSREARNVNDILGLNYHSLHEQVKLVFLDCSLYSTGYGYRRDRPWWSAGEAYKLNLWVSWISEVHAVSLSDAKMMVKELQRLCLVEDSDTEVSVHDLYKEFARVLVETEGSKEWQWWMSESSNATRLMRLVLEADKCRITGRTPRRFVEFRSLVFLELVECDVGPDLELGSFNSLRVLYVIECPFVKRVVCSCNNGDGDGMYCYKRKPARGCLSELVTVKLDNMYILEDAPFLRHCWNLQGFEMWGGLTNPAFPAIAGDAESEQHIDFRYLKALRTFRVGGGRAMLGYDCDAFIRWLLNALQLRFLIAFEYRSEVDEEVGGYMIDLNEAAQLSPKLSVLSVRLPGEIEEVRGLHLLSELTVLNLNFSRGLRRLPDLQWVPKLKWICVHGCCKLDDSLCLGAGVQEISARFRSEDHLEFIWHVLCLDQYCYNYYGDYGIRCFVCDQELNYDYLSNQEKLVFLDCALYYPDFIEWCDRPWWSAGEPNKLNMWVSWISEVHGVSPSEAMKMVKDLQWWSFLKDSDSEVLIHDLYKEFGMYLVERGICKEWQWWVGESSNETHLKRLVLFLDEWRPFGCAPRSYVECRSLVFLQLEECFDVGPDLELGSLNSLRVLYVKGCVNVKRVACSCNNTDGDGIYCYKRDPARGCLSELVTVKLYDMGPLEDLPFLRHCWNLQWFEMSDNLINPTFPAINGGPERGEPIDFGYLKALRTFSVIGGRAMLGYDCDAFIRWLLTALQLRDLISFEYRSNVDEGVGGYTIDLNEVVQLSPRLSVLSLRLPGQVEEVKGLHLFFELTTLNLSLSKGLRRLRFLQWLPKLEWICVHGCCKLDDPPCLAPGVQEISAGFGSEDHTGFCFNMHSECLDQYCYDGYGNYDIQCSICSPWLNHDSLSDQVRLIFLDSALYYPNYGQWCDRPWWSAGVRNKLNLWVLWISEVHGVSPSDAMRMVKELQRMSFLKDSDSEVLIRDMYKEFAMGLVEYKESKEWEWMSESSNATQWNRLLLEADVSRFSGRISKRFVEGRNLVFLEVVECDDVGPDLELGSFNSLRVLYMTQCHNVKRVVCSCICGDGERMYCYKRNPARGCMSELVTVKLKNLESLEDLSFLRHCWNLQWFEMSDNLINPTFPAMNGGPEREEPIDFGYLRALRTFRVIGGRAMLGYDCDAFIRWLLNALQLRDLISFEYRSNVDEGVGGYTIDLNEAVQLSPGLSVLSLRLPGQVEEVKGLHLLSELTILNLNFSRGLLRLSDLQWMPKLKWVCVHGCCKLGGPLWLGRGVEEISAGFGSTDHSGFHFERHSECLDQYCYNEYGDDKLRCSACIELMDFESNN